MPEKVKGVCRLCLSKEGFMFPIFRKDVKSETPFRIKILSCASIEIFADDDLPSEICHNCAHQVEKSFHFRSICENSDAALRAGIIQGTETIGGHSSENPLLLDNSQMEGIQTDERGPSDKDDISCFPVNKIYEPEAETLGMFMCSACSLSFTAYDKLIDHMIEAHPDISLYPCNTCKLYFSQINEYKVHINVKHALSCSRCDYVFRDQNNLELHIKSHLIDVYSCKFCNKIFDKQIDLKKHELTHLEKMCRFCCKVFNATEEYNEHTKTCNETQCKFCSQVFHLRKDLIEHVNNCHENSSGLKCHNCNAIFNKWDELDNHICDVVSEKIITCKYCQQTFADSSHLESHISSEHSDDSLVCKFCTKTFTIKSALRRHEKSHSGLKPYQCKYCPRKFKDNSTCIVHIRTHTGEHPFRCQECHKDFKQLANLKMHTYRHHKINSKTPEEKTEMLKEAEQIYNQFYATPEMETYSADDAKPYQAIDADISSGYSDGSNVLLSEPH